MVLRCSGEDRHFLESTGCMYHKRFVKALSKEYLRLINVNSSRNTAVEQRNEYKGAINLSLRSQNSEKILTFMEM